MLRSPAGAVPGYEQVGTEFGKRADRGTDAGDEEGSAQVQTAEQCVQPGDAGQSLRVADDVIANGMENAQQYRVARQLLRARSPRLQGGAAFLQSPGESAIAFAIRVVKALDHTVLAIQGPPGAGKTFTGAQMICELVKHGAQVGVTAASTNHQARVSVAPGADNDISISTSA